jgi:hypothetical protein
LNGCGRFNFLLRVIGCNDADAVLDCLLGSRGLSAHPIHRTVDDRFLFGDGFQTYGTIDRQILLMGVELSRSY